MSSRRRNSTGRDPDRGPTGYQARASAGNRALVKRALVVSAVGLGLAFAGCGQSGEDKAKDDVCDARADIQKKVSGLQNLTLATASVDQVKIRPQRDQGRPREDLGRAGPAGSDSQAAGAEGQRDVQVSAGQLDQGLGLEPVAQGRGSAAQDRHRGPGERLRALLRPDRLPLRRHSGSDNAKYLAISSPGVMTPDYFREIHDVLASTPAGPPDRAKIAEVMRRHGLTPAPPAS